MTDAPTMNAGNGAPGDDPARARATMLDRMRAGTLVSQMMMAAVARPANAEVSRAY